MTNSWIKFLSLPVAQNELRITSRFGRRQTLIPGASLNHQGLDIGAPVGTPVRSVADGTVLSARVSLACGQGVIIEHTSPSDPSRTFLTGYCHLEFASPQSYGIVAGVNVTAGQTIGRIGRKSGISSAPHLHLWLRNGKLNNRYATYIDPEPYLTLATPVQPVTPSSTTATSVPSATAGTGTTTVSPYISSFESFHPRIQYELSRRSLATETANTYMPFVKLTSLLKIDKENLQGVNSAWCPTLGIHGQSEETFENIYFPQGNKSIVAYATTIKNGKPIRIPVTVENSDADQNNIPIPGIVSVSTERSTAGPMGVRGGLFRANLKLVAYSVGQLDTLLKYYLRPATRVVLEFGRTSSSATEPRVTPFKWEDTQTNITNKIRKLITDQREQEKFIKETVYDNYGNYEIFIGYVVKFNLKYTKNNVYEIDLTVHSVQQFEVPSKHTGLKSICGPNAVDKCKVMDVLEYFDESYSWKANSFKQLMKSATEENGRLYNRWNKHIVALRQPRNENNQAKSGTNNKETNTREGGYLISWEFFVNVLLNDEVQGLFSIFPLDSLQTEAQNLLKSSLIKPVNPNIVPDSSKLIANEVGYHPNLRSVDPGKILIYNVTANQTANSTGVTMAVENRAAGANIRLTDSPISTQISGSVIGSFDNLLQNKNSEPGTSLLTKGVWLNTNMIAQCFMGTDTISAGLNLILTRMNEATEGYWNLQLLSNDTTNSGLHVIDMGLSKNKSQGNSAGLSAPLPTNISVVSQIKDSLTNTEQLISSYYGDVSSGTPKYTYVFNKKLRVGDTDDTGSDLLDINVEFNLPQVVAVQAIAGIGGVAQKSMLQSIDIPGLQRLSLLPELYVTCSSSDTSTNAPCPNDPIISLEQQLTAANREQRLANAQFDNSINNPTVRGEFAPISAAGRLIRAEGNVVSAKAAVAGQTLNNDNVLPIIREYNHLGNALRFIEFNPSQMMERINKDSADEQTTKTQVAHAFNSSNLTKTIVDLTLPGVGGIQLFQSFLVDRIPSILNKGYYIVTKVSHEFSTERGWITKIQGRFRYQPQVK
jgi:hypothetical protein